MADTQQAQQQAQRQQPQQPLSQQELDRIALQQYAQTPREPGFRPGVIRESRIKDRPESNNLKDDSLKIKIELDLEVEVDLYARVKGDVTIGLL